MLGHWCQEKLVRHSILEFVNWLCESQWIVLFPLIGAAVLVIGPIAKAALGLGLWFQVVGVALSSFLYLGYAASVSFVAVKWYMVRPGGLTLNSAKHAISTVKKISRNRTLMLLLLLPFILYEIYIHSTSLSNLNLNMFFIGSFFAFSFIAYLGAYLGLYFQYFRRNPLSGAVLYFAASAGTDEISSSIKLAASATELLSKAITKKTGVLRMRTSAPLFTTLFLQDQRKEMLIQLAQSCVDIKNAITTVAAVTHTNTESMLEHTTFGQRLLSLPLDGILGILTVLVDILFRYTTFGH